MGEMIVGPEWLFLECHGGHKHSLVARAIYRAFILHRKRTGHIMDLDDDACRKQVIWGITHGRIQHFIVRCARCACPAWLGDWVKSGEFDEDRRIAILADNPEQRLAGNLCFLAKCPGGIYKRVVHTENDWPEVL